MVRRMQFFPELSGYLREHGVIYTVRKYDMDLRLVEAEGAGLCKRIPLGEVKDTEDLREYADESGFDTLEDWVKKIKSMIPKGSPWYLYKVEVVQGGT